MKKTWKKCCSLIVAAGMVFALAACSSGTAAPSADTEKETEAPADVSAVDSVEDSDDASAGLSAAASEEASAALSADAAAFSTAAAAEFSTAEAAAFSTEEAPETASTAATDGAQTAAEGINYLVLVNKIHPLPEGWEDALETVHTTNSLGDDVEVEKKTYDAYLLLKEDLEKEGVYVDLDSGRRSVADQQRIMDDFTKKYGADYAAKTVATPGFSEHHTGLALDLYLIIDGVDVVENEDMIQYPEIWEKIHAKIADYGFVLRFLEGKEHLTGYGYEPWHIRYVDSVDIAKEIMSTGVTLESYLGDVNETDVDIDYGTSELYSQEDLEEAAIQIKCSFASWKGCELHSLRYAGDECCTEENIAWLNSHEGVTEKYTQVAEFLGSFHSPVESGLSPLTPDTEYTDYQWWLGRTENGGWEIVDSGY